MPMSLIREFCRCLVLIQCFILSPSVVSTSITIASRDGLDGVTLFLRTTLMRMVMATEPIVRIPTYDLLLTRL